MRTRAKEGTSVAWPWPERPRILFEQPDAARAAVASESLRRAGYAVAVCAGPTERRACPACSTRSVEGCAAAAGADVIVSSLGLDGREAQDVVRALRMRYPDAALIVEATPSEASRHAALLEGCDVVDPPVAPEQILDAAEAAIARRSGR